jgi:hypothetical protein
VRTISPLYFKYLTYIIITGMVLHRVDRIIDIIELVERQGAVPTLGQGAGAVRTRR